MPGKVTTYLTFQEKGEEAVKFYVSLFKSSRIHGVQRWGKGGPVPEGALMNASFELDGQHFMAMDAGPQFQFGEGFSIYVDCEDQAEVDRLSEKLGEGGQIQMCGWLKDRWGVSWQIIPTVLPRLMGDKDPAKAGRVMQAMLKMKKIVIRDLEEAYKG